ncbi:MAG: translation initiation factor IF-3 [Flavobacteriaceae bacterium]|nr:translation initiation factor IF-3 [Flavobacteriaceae bacterium]OUV86629.1 MAG: translation initiation factor IF-3 [Flavobacteriaceae bacterium TMED145]
MAIRRTGRGRRPWRVQKTNPHKINGEISASEVRLVGDNVEIGIYPIQKALEKSNELELDLVQISPNAVPPVCKIMDYKKFLYEQKKREKQLKSKATKVFVKEIRFGPQTDEHDYAFKKKHAEKFLKDGAKLKAFVFFKGRSIIYKDQGEILLLKLAQELEKFGKVEQLPKLESKKMIMIMSPKKSK